MVRVFTPEEWKEQLYGKDWRTRGAMSQTMSPEALDRLERQLKLLADRNAGDLAFWRATAFVLLGRLKEAQK